MIKILLAEDHEVLRDGLKSFLKEDPEIEVVAEASNGKEAIEELKKKPVDLILLDLNMPIMNGLDTARHIKEHFRQVKILVLSMLDHPKYVEDLIMVGINGYALKNIGKTELIFAIKKVMRGQIYISSEINLQKLRSTEPDETILKEESVVFSKREMEVLALIAEGLTNNEIAARLFTSRRTIESHRKSLIEKTKSKNTATLIRYAINNGLLK